LDISWYIIRVIITFQRFSNIKVKTLSILSFFPFLRVTLEKFFCHNNNNYNNNININIIKPKPYNNYNYYSYYTFII